MICAHTNNKTHTHSYLMALKEGRVELVHRPTEVLGSKHKGLWLGSSHCGVEVNKPSIQTSPGFSPVCQR